jgi:hypothetical protein
MVTTKRATAMCMAFHGVIAKPHFDRTAFRTSARIFATLGPGGRDLNVFLSPDEQAAISQSRAGFAPLDNAWGRRGATRADLAVVDEAALQDALTWAYAHALPKPKKQRAKR